MKKIIPLLAFCAPLFLYAQISKEGNKGIYFETGMFAEILAKAKKENKIIMVDAFTSWCGPCKWMAKNIFPNDTVAEFYNKNFINLGMDMEKGEGIDIAKKYEVRCYPTFLFIDGDGQLLHRQSGSMEVKNFVELGADAMDPEKQFASCKKKYDSGISLPADVIQYIALRSRSCMPVADELAKYFSTQKEDELTNRQNWSALRDFTKDANSREFQYFISHRTDFEKLYTADSVSRKIEHVYSSALFGFINTRQKEPDLEGYKKMKDQISKLNLSLSEKIILNADMNLYKTTKDWKNYTKTAIAYTDKYAKDDYNTLNDVAWSFYENVSDKTMLAKAAEWAKYSVELHPEYSNCDTHAAVLYKLGRKKEAQEAAEKAIELAKKEGEDYSTTQEMLEIIKKMR